MIRISILCEDKDVEQVRVTSLKLMNHKSMTIPCSITGDFPITHWFCSMNTNEELYNKLLTAQKYSIIEAIGPKQFLNRWNMKIIK
jgi:hypothetical protein